MNKAPSTRLQQSCRRCHLRGMRYGAGSAVAAGSSVCLVIKCLRHLGACPIPPEAPPMVGAHEGAILWFYPALCRFSEGDWIRKD